MAAWSLCFFGGGFGSPSDAMDLMRERHAEVTKDGMDELVSMAPSGPSESST
jgi:hypothetical protein